MRPSPSGLSASRALKAAAVVGLVFALAACAATPSTTTSATTTGSGASTSGSQARTGTRTFQGASGVTGDVVTVNGSTFTVEDPQQSGPYTTVEMTDSTQILKQATSTLASVKVGESVNAVGSEANGVFTAAQVRVMSQTALGAGPAGGAPPSGTPRLGFGQRPGANGQGASGQGADGQGANGRGANGRGGPAQAAGGQGRLGQGSGGSVLFGTVEQAGADSLTVKAADGTTTQVRLASDGQVTTEEAVTAKDITPGTRVVVGGDEQDGKVTATRVLIIPAARQ